MRIFLLLIAIVAAGVGLLAALGARPAVPRLPQVASAVVVSSPTFAQGEIIPKKYTCDGQDTNPPLTISGVPEQAQSLAIIVDDPDAPLGTWNHWLVWNIPPQTTEIAEATTPRGAIEGTSDFGKLSYAGPCPPSGTHRYFFRVYARDTSLALPPAAKRKELDQAMSGHILAQGELMGRHRR